MRKCNSFSLYLNSVDFKRKVEALGDVFLFSQTLVLELLKVSEKQDGYYILMLDQNHEPE